MLDLCLAYLDDDYDKKLFENIFNAYKKQMITLAISILQNKDDAEDVVGDVFLRIAQKNWDVVRKIENNTDLRNYLLKATKNTALNRIKSKNNYNVPIDTVMEQNIGNIQVLSDDSFVDAICDKVEYDKIIEAISSLDNKYRDVLYYHFVLEMTVPQTAKAFEQSLITTKKQLVRGKKMLLSLLSLKGVDDNGNK